ncbi:MAG: methyltransferase domain-containing protein [Candidatus Omnitrophota bacterium]
MILSRIKQECRYLTAPSWSFAELAKFWDSLIDYEDKNEEAYSYFRRFTDAYKLSQIKDDSEVLDICSRSGYGTLLFSRHGKIRQAVCADVSQRLLEVCLSRLKKEGIEVEGVRIENLPLPFTSGRFDAILCFETVEHMPQPEIFIKELGRVIKTGGELILTTPNVLWEPLHSLAAVLNLHHSEGPHRFLSRKKLRRYLADAGFAIKTEATTVLLPFNNRFSIEVNDWLEKQFWNSLLPLLGLRRIFISVRT